MAEIKPVQQQHIPNLRLLFCYFFHSDRFKILNILD